MGKSKCGCFCFKKKKRQASHIEPALSHSANEIQHPVRIPINNAVPNIPSDNIARIEVPRPPRIIVTSNYTPEEIEPREITPASTMRGIYKYSCPVCLRYFNRVLLTKCCNNYLCHHCAYDLQNKELHFDVRCHYCSQQPVYLSDVDPNESVKKYSDSPYSTHKAGTQGPKWITINLDLVEEASHDVEYTTAREQRHDYLSESFPTFKPCTLQDEGSHTY